jgi:DedD protein
MPIEADNYESHESKHMTDPQDTEITLGTGKMLAVFFGLVVLCSGFFALGYKLGRGSGNGGELSSSTFSTTGVKSPATKPATNPAPDVAPKAVTSDNVPAAVTPPDATSKPADASATPAGTGTPADPTAAPAPPASSYFVQVAAVSKQEDADALVDALKKKQYTAFATTMADKLLHVQVGPFIDIKDAEATRAKLVSDGYNPILKK